MNDITPKEAIANLNHIYGMVAPDIQRSLDVAIKALERPTGDCISRSVLDEIRQLYKKYQPNLATEVIEFGNALEELIDNAQAVEYTFEEAFQKTVCENRLYCPARPKGECVDISKLRLMTVEECAGHTIDYAMGWKACIEWIKKGGAE